MKVILHNHMTRNIGRFRATGGAKDHKHDCRCGGACDDCRKHARLRSRDEYSRGEMGIDVTYAKGNMFEHRHFTVPDVLIDPHGQQPSGEFVADHLRRLSEHQRMTNSGWTAKKAEGYYKREQRDVGKMV